MLALLLANIGTPAGAIPGSSSEPPWWVRARAAAERRFTLRAVSFSEQQESLRIAAFDQFLEVIDSQTGEAHGSRLPGDPALLNRKFDLSFEQSGAGAGLSIALPRLGVLYPTLAFDAAEAHVDLDFHDITEPRDSTSLRGRGALFDTRLDVVASPCRHCAWFTATGYRFEKLPSFDVDRSPRFNLDGFSVSTDDVRLGREVHEISSLVGYTPPSGRLTSFVGVQHRWTDLEIDDRLAYRDPISDNHLSSRTRLESEATLAIAGLEVTLGARWFSRLETAVGDGDWSVGINLAYEPSGSSRPTSRMRNARLAEQIARLRSDFAQEVANLPQIGWAAAARALLDRFEKRLLELLPLPELDALQSLVRYRFDQARRQLVSAAQQPEPSPSNRGAHPGYVPASFAVFAQGTPPRYDCGPLRSICEQLDRLVWLIEHNDLTIPLCIQTRSPAAPRAFSSYFRVLLLPWMYLENRQSYWSTRTSADRTAKSLKAYDTNENKPIPRGLYGYSARRLLADHRSYEEITCPGEKAEERDCAPLNLADLDFPFVDCTAQGCQVHAQDKTWPGCR